MHQSPACKRRYSSPKLTVYGSVAKLTKGGTGTRPDGGNFGHNHGRGRNN